MTQHNAALVELAAGSSGALAVQANNLVATVSLFKLSQADKQRQQQQGREQPAATTRSRGASQTMLLPATG